MIRTLALSLCLTAGSVAGGLSLAQVHDLWTEKTRAASALPVERVAALAPESALPVRFDTDARPESGTVADLAELSVISGFTVARPGLTVSPVDMVQADIRLLPTASTTVDRPVREHTVAGFEIAPAVPAVRPRPRPSSTAEPYGSIDLAPGPAAPGDDLVTRGGLHSPHLGPLSLPVARAPTANTRPVPVPRYFIGVFR